MFKRFVYSQGEFSTYEPSGNYTHHCTTRLTNNNSTFCPHIVSMCFVWISKQTAIISLWNINWPVCTTDTQCVYCAVSSEFLKSNFRRQIKVSIYRKCLLSLPAESSLQWAHLLYKRLGGPQTPRGQGKSLFNPKIESGLSSPVTPSLVNTPIWALRFLWKSRDQFWTGFFLTLKYN